MKSFVVAQQTPHVLATRCDVPLGCCQALSAAFLSDIRPASLFYWIHRCGVRPSTSFRSCPRDPSPGCVPLARTARCAQLALSGPRREPRGTTFCVLLHVQILTSACVHNKVTCGEHDRDPTRPTRFTRSIIIHKIHWREALVHLWSLEHREAHQQSVCALSPTLSGMHRLKTLALPVAETRLGIAFCTQTGSARVPSTSPATQLHTMTHMSAV